MVQVRAGYGTGCVPKFRYSSCCRKVAFKRDFERDTKRKRETEKMINLSSENSK